MIVILGAGLAGLSAAYHLRQAGRTDILILEKEAKLGGLTRSEHVDGYTFDYTGHFLHFRRPEIQTWVTSLCGENLHQVARRAWIYSQATYTPYPFQANTYGLPAEVIQECLLGFIEASTGSKTNGQVEGDPAETSFEDWILSTFGRGIAKYFMIPYNTKLWTIPPGEMTCEWMGRFVPRPSLAEVVEGALVDRREKPFGYNAFFWYPLTGGIAVLPNALAVGTGPVQLGVEVDGIDLRRRRVSIRDGEPIEYETLITTLPLSRLVRLLQPIPDEVRQAGARLRHNSVLSLNLGIEGRQVCEHNWVYFPEPEFTFYRLGFPTNSSPHMAPPGASSVTAEVSFSDERPIDRAETVRRVKKDLERVGILKPGDRIGVEVCFEIPCAYVLYDRERKRSVAAVRQYLKSQGVHSVGRYGAWEYSSMEDAIVHGKEAAAEIARAEVRS